MQKITPCLWFDGNAEEAINYYISVFTQWKGRSAESKILTASRWGEGGPFPKDTLLAATFLLNGQEFMALNGGPQYKFTEAVSMLVRCKDQEEVDQLWEQLTEGGEIQMCGWLKDKYGLSWQIIPDRLGELMADKDPVKAGRVSQAMLQMKKIEVAKLEAAYAGE